MVLKPLEMKMLADIRRLILDLHDEVMGELKEIKGILTSPATDVPAEEHRLLNASLSVPEALATRLDESLVQARPECQDPNNFPLQLGMDAFQHYFQEGNATSETDSYLNLMKCLWIMDKIKTSTEFKRLPDGSLWQRYVKRMDFRLAKEYDRWAASLAPEPDMDTILRLPDDEFRVWKTDDEEGGDELIGGDSVFLTELLNINLPSEGGKSTHKLRVLQNVDGTIQVQDTASTTSGNREINDVHRFDAYLDKAQLIPIYASPSSTSAALNIKFKSDKDSANGISPSFGNLGDLLKFQEIITGYRPVLYRGDLHVECHSSAKFSLTGSTTKEKGRVQIWQRKRPAHTRTKNEGSHSSTASPMAPIESDAGPQNNPGRRLSKTSTSPTDKTFLDKWRRDSTLSAATFSTMEGSVSSTIFTGTNISRLDTGSGTVGVRMDRPEMPKLVLFLESKKTGSLSFLSVAMNENTFINEQACDCRLPRSRCAIAVIEHSKGPLSARRIESKLGLKSWNLASLGTSQPPPKPDPHALRDLRWVKLQFASFEDKEKFRVRFNEVHTIYKNRVADFYRHMEIVKGRNVVTTEFRRISTND
ncbi:hypothetical protein MPH_11126 [Macrophomina phaseolina MS6]|uniref:Uncharacterized protein n=2 Tax=Macrophomina phaseolina TaxID=35725 RepID=K2RAV0_MACPH|nr:hypothetical protein MPH_11126 [Macrophomina phaseolina MS6]